MMQAETRRRGPSRPTRFRSGWLAACLAGAGLLLIPAAASLAQSAGAGRQEDMNTGGVRKIERPHADASIWSRALSAGKVSDRAFRDLMGNDETWSRDPRVATQGRALAESTQARETQRSEQIAELSTELDSKLVDEPVGTDLTDALRLAVTLQQIVSDESAFLAEPRMRGLVSRAEAAAREAEAGRQWILANELFFRLDALHESAGSFRDDVRRTSNRLALIRLYAPERFWELRNDRRIAVGMDPLPEFNGLGEEFRTKLDGISLVMVARAVSEASRQHVDPSMHDLRALVAAGVEGVRLLATTDDLSNTFAGLQNEANRMRFETFLDRRLNFLRSPGAPGMSIRDLADEITMLVETAREVVGLPAEAVLHEFGNGALGSLDEYSSIVWPDEVKRFERMTRGRFEGIGVHIQFDDEVQMIRVLTPLEGTPAFRAGVMAGDRIKAIDGKSAIGLSLGQAVEKITGPSGTKVKITIERPSKEVEVAPEEFDVEIVRAAIDLPSVKGWRKTGPADEDWDWFIDTDNGIGYLRLSGFQESTTDEILSAVGAMRKSGTLKGLVFDLRFNPGGLLTEAVNVANLFVDRGEIVSTRSTPNSPIEPKTESARPGRAVLRDLPVAILINEGSASASEIVSGAVRYYADRGEIPAVLVGRRTFGKGSVQNVWPLTHNSYLKLTTQHYVVPSADGGRVINRRPGHDTWGVDPHVEVEMLPAQVSKALLLRQDADVWAIDGQGRELVAREDRPDPNTLLTDNVDIQLQTALFLVQSKVLAGEKQNGGQPSRALTDAR